MFVFGQLYVINLYIADLYKTVLLDIYTHLITQRKRFILLDFQTVRFNLIISTGLIICQMLQIVCKMSCF